MLARAKSELSAQPGLRHPPEMVALLALGAVDGWFRYRGLYERIAAIPPGDREADDAFFSTLVDLMPVGEGKP